MSNNNNNFNWGSVAGGVLGMIGGHQSERRNYRNNRRLMNQQYGNQRMLNEHGHDLQMDMWNKTNYGAQVGHMKEAGLNPALMYGSAGQGGTTGSQGGGSASMGSSQQGKVMDLQNALVGAQIDGIKAKAESDRANANKTSGVDTDKVGADIKNINQDTLKKVEETSNLKTTGEILEFEKDVKEEVAKRAGKGLIQGDVVGNILTQAGLDPVNNEYHRALLWGLFGANYAAKLFKDVMTGYFAKRGGIVPKHNNVDDFMNDKTISAKDKKAVMDAINNAKNL